MKKTHTPQTKPHLIGLLVLAAFTANADVLYFQNFNTPNSATPLADFAWTAFSGGAPSAPSTVSSGTTTGGVFGTERAAHVNLNTTSATTSWFGGLFYDYANPLPTINLSEISLSANVYGGGSVGDRGDAILRLESSSGNWLGFSKDTSVNNGQILGGFLSDATESAGTFNPSASSFRIAIAFANTLSTWGNDSSNILGIDNVTLTAIPEPSTLLLVGLAGVAVAMRGFRRQNRLK